ncbi:hypothetical protein GYMLUDRAFT_32810 [Collybiopsis luxurians FD-317 M1]|nr:hypothetical protein GYMLUDRAFT_32810 [Collybiopsis luxurians FD-317 M1]
MTSSLRNSIHRRNHKERSQLAHRAKLGFLEKHKDYVKRARDYHSKQDRLTRLKQKAAERNKDEFYFAMTKESTKGGVHIKDRGNVALPTDVVKVLKTQDENYLRTMRAAGLKKIDKIKAQLSAMADLVKPDEELEEGNEGLKVLREAHIFSGQSRKGRKRHIVFVDDDEAARSYVPPSQPSDLGNPIENGSSQSSAALGWKERNEQQRFKRRKSQHDFEDEDNERDEEVQGLSEATQHKQHLLKELSARLVRDKQMRYAAREFEMQRMMMGKGARRKVRAPEKVGDNDESEDDEDALDARGGRPKRPSVKSDETYRPRVYKWRIERKR